MTIET